jgi:hypothetical protein
VPPLIGINLPWFAGAYGHDLAPNLAHPGWPVGASRAVVRAALERCRELGVDAVRFWVCERGEGVLHEDGMSTGVAPELLAALDRLQDDATALGLRLYPSLLDGNSWIRDDDRLLGRLIDDPDAARRFCDRVVRPIVAHLAPSLVTVLEIVNEPEQMTFEGAGPLGKSWSAMAAFLGLVRDAARAEHPALLLSASAQHGILPKLHAAAPFLDRLDLHRYCDDGSLPPIADLGLAPGAPPVLAGECGLAGTPTDDGEDALDHFVWNAARWGYEAVFLWRLEGAQGLLRESGHWRTRAHKVIEAIAGVRASSSAPR